MPDKLPEEFAPTGPKLSRFPIRPAPPIRPHLFADEARFALRLSVLAGATELAAWAWLCAHFTSWWIFGFLALRLLKPFWGWLGTRVPRTSVAFGLVFAALFGIAASWFGAAPVGLLAAGLPAVADLCVSCAGDSVTVERRAAAYAWLDMAQGLGLALGVGLGLAWPAAAPAVSVVALLVSAVGISDLHDRGTPRSMWPAAAFRHALRSPMGAQIALLALLCGLFAQRSFGWPALVLVLAGMAVASRLEPRMPNAVWLPRAAVALAALSLALHVAGPFALGMMCVALPAAVARGAGEMERPVVSSLAWSALVLGFVL